MESSEMIRRTFLLTLLILTSFSVVVSGDTSARSCSAAENPSVHHITINPGGPLSMPADQALNISATAYNSAGNELGNVPIAWTTSSGTIQNFGGGQARWSPQMVGPQTVTACNGDVQTTLDVNVQPGAPLTFELSVSQSNVTADDTLEITPLLRDQNGNGWIPNIPYANWLLPDDVGISLPNDGTPPILTPGPVGEMTVSVDWDGWTGSTSFNVSLGVAVDLIIQHESAIVSSDDLIDLCAQYSDQRGNMWNVNSTWSTLGSLANEALSSFIGECIVFDAGLIGDWTVQIEDGNGMSDSLTLTIESGRLAHISLDELPTEMHIGDFYLLEADGFDAAGNAVIVDGWNWSITDGPSSTDPIVPDGDGITFVPDRIGQHTIQVMAAGRVQAIDVEVLSGIPVSLEIEMLDGSPTTPPIEIVTGLSLDLLLYGVDINGNRYLVDVPIDGDGWGINQGTIEYASAGGTGHYTYTSGGRGDVSINVFLNNSEGGQAQGILIVQVLEGPLDHLEIELPSDGDQGTTVQFEISGFDISGYPVPIHQCSATITTDAGEAECDENGWTLYLDTPGELVVHARIQSSSGSSAEGSDFITVHSTWFGWGNDTQVIIASSILIILVISAILVLLFKHLGSRIEEEIDLLEEENQESEDIPPPLGSIDFGGTLPPPPQIAAPVANVPNPPPPTQHHLPPVVSAPPVQPVMVQSTPTTTYDPFFALQPTIEPTPESIAVVENVEEDWATPEPEPELEPEPEVQTDDEWGEMSGGWGGEVDTLSTAAATFAKIQYENRRGDGPRDSAEQTLRPLPGTAPGADGWYFDSEGRPSEWRHTEEKGWNQE